MYETSILSVQQTTFKGRDGEPDRIMWKVYCADSTGAVGCIYSTKERKAGEIAQLDLVVNRDGRFTAKLLRHVVVSVFAAFGGVNFTVYRFIHSDFLSTSTIA